MTDLQSVTSDQEEHWIPLSDLMTGLMMIFLLIAIIFMVQVERQTKEAQAQARTIEQQATTIKNIATKYSDVRAQLYDDLNEAFKGDWNNWRAVLARDLSIRFEEPNVQFDTGQTLIKPDFARILNSFFPRYARILNSPKYRDEIEEVRIEGHTSSIWGALDPEAAYYENMRLSQERTRAVLQYLFKLPDVRDQLGWLVPRVTANGMSSSRRVFGRGGEDVVASQRVEFRVRTKAEDRLEEILRSNLR